jgi:hypothetical protein
VDLGLTVGEADQLEAEVVDEGDGDGELHRGGGGFPLSRE